MFRSAESLVLLILVQEPLAIVPVSASHPGSACHMGRLLTISTNRTSFLIRGSTHRNLFFNCFCHIYCHFPQSRGNRHMCVILPLIIDH